MAGIIAAASIAALSGGYKIYQGNKTRKKGERKEDSLSRYKYEIPNEIGDNQALSQNLANQGIPDAERNAYLDDINQTQANSINNFKGRKGGLFGAEVVGGQSQDALRKLRLDDTRERLSNLKQLMISNQVMADYKDKQFQLNEIDPYQDDLSYARSLQGAGRMSMNNGLDSIASSANSFIQGYASTTPQSDAAETKKEKEREKKNKKKIHKD